MVNFKVKTTGVKTQNCIRNSKKTHFAEKYRMQIKALNFVHYTVVYKSVLTFVIIEEMPS